MDIKASSRKKSSHRDSLLLNRGLGRSKLCRPTPLAKFAEQVWSVAFIQGDTSGAGILVPMGSDCVLGLPWGQPLPLLANAHVLRTYHADFMALSIMKKRKVRVSLGGRLQVQLLLDCGAVWGSFQIPCS